MNIIFLDIDGPLLPKKSFLFKENNIGSRKFDDSMMVPKFDEFSVRVINLWAKYSDAKVVLSTDWAFDYSVEKLRNIMYLNGVSVRYHTETITPKKLTSCRENEIRWWLEEHSSPGDKFIAVDDDLSCRHLKDLKSASDGAIIRATGEWIEVDYANGISYQNFLDGCKTLEIDVNLIETQEFN